MGLPPEIIISAVSGIIGSLMGSIVGSSLQYYFNVQSEKRKRHKEALERIRDLVSYLRSTFSVFRIIKKSGYRESVQNVYPKDAQDVSNKIIEISGRLNGGKVQAQVVKTLRGGGYDSFEDLYEAICDLEKSLKYEANPDLSEAIESVDPEKGEWAGPASSRFIEKMFYEDWVKTMEPVD